MHIGQPIIDIFPRSSKPTFDQASSSGDRGCGPQACSG